MIASVHPPISHLPSSAPQRHPTTKKNKEPDAANYIISPAHSSPSAEREWLDPLIQAADRASHLIIPPFNRRLDYSFRTDHRETSPSKRLRFTAKKDLSEKELQVIEKISRILKGVSNFLQGSLSTISTEKEPYKSVDQKYCKKIIEVNIPQYEKLIVQIDRDLLSIGKRSKYLEEKLALYENAKRTILLTKHHFSTLNLLFEKFSRTHRFNKLYISESTYRVLQAISLGETLSSPILNQTLVQDIEDARKNHREMHKPHLLKTCIFTHPIHLLGTATPTLFLQRAYGGNSSKNAILKFLNEALMGTLIPPSPPNLEPTLLIIDDAMPRILSPYSGKRLSTVKTTTSDPNILNALFLKIAIPIFRTLASYNKFNTIHGYIREHNIIIGGTTIKISHLGKMPGDEKEPFASNEHAAPELFQPKMTLTSSSDIWESGIVLYNLLATRSSKNKSLNGLIRNCLLKTKRISLIEYNDKTPLPKAPIKAFFETEEAQSIINNYISALPKSYGFSDEIKNLLMQMLCINPKKRITTPETLEILLKLVQTAKYPKLKTTATTIPLSTSYPVAYNDFTGDRISGGGQES